MARSTKFDYQSRRYPAGSASYILDLADADNIANVPLSDVNEILNLLEDDAEIYAAGYPVFA